MLLFGMKLMVFHLTCFPSHSAARGGICITWGGGLLGGILCIGGYIAGKCIPGQLDRSINVLLWASPIFVPAVLNADWNGPGQPELTTLQKRCEN